VTRSIPIVEARNKLTTLPEQLAQEPEPGVVAVTRRGKPVLAVMPWDQYESMVETMEILADDKAMAALRRGVREITTGKGVPWEQAKRKLRL